MSLNFYRELALLSYQSNLQSNLQAILKNAKWHNEEGDLIMAKRAAKHLDLLHKRYKSSPLLNSSQSLPISQEKGLSFSDFVNWLTSKFKLKDQQTAAAGRYRNQLEDNDETKEELKKFRESHPVMSIFMQSHFKVVMVSTNPEDKQVTPVNFEKFVELMTSQLIPQSTITREEFHKLLAHPHFQNVLQILDTIQGFVVPNLEVLAHFQSNPKKYFSKIGASLERPLSQAIVYETLFSLLAEERLILFDRKLFLLANNGEHVQHTSDVSEITLFDCFQSLVESLPLRMETLIVNKVIKKKMSNDLSMQSVEGYEHSDQEIAHRYNIYYKPIKEILDSSRAQLPVSPIGLRPFPIHARFAKNPFQVRFDKKCALLLNTVTVIFRSEEINSLRDISIKKEKDSVFLAKDIIDKREGKFKEAFQGTYQHVFLPSFVKIPGSLVEVLLNPANFSPNIDAESIPYKDFLPIRVFKPLILENPENLLETLVQSPEYPYYIFKTPALLKGYSFLFFKYLPFGLLPLLLLNPIGTPFLVERPSTLPRFTGHSSGHTGAGAGESSSQSIAQKWVYTANDQLASQLNRKLDFSSNTSNTNEILYQFFVKIVPLGWQKTFLGQDLTIAPSLKIDSLTERPSIDKGIKLDINLGFLGKGSEHKGFPKDLSSFYRRVDFIISDNDENNLSLSAGKSRLNSHFMEICFWNPKSATSVGFDSNKEVSASCQLKSGFFGIEISDERSDVVQPYLTINARFLRTSIRIKPFIKCVFSLFSNKSKEVVIELPSEESIDSENVGNALTVPSPESSTSSIAPEALETRLGPIDSATINTNIIKKAAYGMSWVAREQLVLSAFQKARYQVLFDKERIVAIIIRGQEILGECLKSLLPYGLMASPLHPAIKVALAIGGCVFYTQAQHLTICLEKKEGGAVTKLFVRTSLLVAYQFGVVRLAWVASYLNYAFNLLLGMDTHTKLPFFLERWDAIDRLVEFIGIDKNTGVVSLFLNITLIQILPIFLTGCFLCHIFYLSSSFYKAVLLRSSSDIRFYLISLFLLPVFLTFQETNRRWLAQDPEIKASYLAKVREKLIANKPSS